jgi:hemoglobin/transferrin/lactoferrin receptor protein
VKNASTPANDWNATAGRSLVKSLMHILAAILCCTMMVPHTGFAAQRPANVIGVVRDGSSAPIAGAEVVLMSQERTPLARGISDERGHFKVPAPAPGQYVVAVRMSQFGESRTTVTVAEGDTAPLEIVLDVGAIREEVTVTATRDAVSDLRTAGQPVNVIDNGKIGGRVTTVVAQAVEGETGVQLQRTSPAMAGIFVRGLTGNKVNVFVDGVRYSTGAQRGGVNTFLDLIEPDALDAIEVVRGPSSAQYGSDALGGSIQFLSRPPVLGVTGAPRWNGLAGASLGSAHRVGGGNVTVGYMGDALGITATASGRKAGSIRTGGGIDSHAAVTRFFGIPSDALMDARLPDTGFGQVGGSIRSNWLVRPDTHVVSSYVRAYQDNGKRYDQLLGGDGNLISDLNGLSLDLLSIRIERHGLKWFDYASLTYSLNSQREERVNQGGNGNPTATIGHEPERTTANGIQALFSSQISPRQSIAIGGDVYFEGLSSDSFNVNPVNQAVSPRRPRVPDGASYTHGGAYVQTTFELKPERVKLMGAFRVAGASYAAHASDSPIVNGAPLWPDDSLTVSNASFRAAAVITPAEPWTFQASVSRGFRAPHMTDLGTLGLTGAGFEVAAPDVAGLDGAVGTTADAAAVSTGRAVAQVGSETSVQYEGSVRYRRKTFRTDVTFFVNDVHDNIQKQSLILPQGAVGLTLGGTPIVAQTPNGTVFVAASTNPVLVRANFDNARIWGIEHSAEARVTPSITLNTAFTYLRARDTETDLPPNIEGGTPAPDGWVSVRWMRTDGRYWIEPYTHFAWEQTHLSSLDLGDRRTGAGRSRTSIRAFFLNGARARGWIGAGADGSLGTADDVLTVTGETLAQIQDRVLGVGVNSSSLFPSIPGYATFGVRVGAQFGRHQFLIDAENLNDENYRGLSWGVDAPGAGVRFKYVTRF